MNIVEKINGLSSSKPSNWREKAEWIINNKNWLRYSQKIANVVLSALSLKKDFTQKDLAEKLDVTPQYVSKLLKGQENLTLKTIAGLEDALGVQFLNINIHAAKEQLAPSNVFQFDFAKAVKSDSKLNNDNMCYTEDNNEAA